MKISAQKILVSIIFVLCLLIVKGSQSSAFALEINSRTSLEFDETLTDTSVAKYKYPEKILVTQISNPSGEVFASSDEWIDTLYYYSITRFGFSDIPYHYIIDESGKVFQTRSGWVGSVPELDQSEGVVLIGYLSNKTMTQFAEKSLKDLFSDLASKYGFELKDISTVKLSLVSKPLTTTQAVDGTGVINSTNTAVTATSGDSTLADPNVDASKKDISIYKIKYSTVNNAFASSVYTIARGSSLRATPNQRNFVAEISNVQYAKEVKTGDTVPVTITVTNKNDFVWFNDFEYIYVSTANGKISPLVINGEWDSFNKPTNLGDQPVFPGQSVTVDFNVYIAVPPVTKYTSNYKLVTQSGKTVASSEFLTDFKINTGSLAFAKVSVKNADSIFVRKCASYSCKEIGYVRNGQIFPILEESNGWYKVNYDGVTTGWINGNLCQKI